MGTHLFGSPCTKSEEKKWGDMAYYIPPPKKGGGHVPHVPHQIAPMLVYINLNVKPRKLVLTKNVIFDTTTLG